MKANLNGSHYYLYLDWAEFQNLPVEAVVAKVKREGSGDDISELVKVGYSYEHRGKSMSRIEHEPHKLLGKDAELTSISLCYPDYSRIKKEKFTIIRSGLFSYQIEVVNRIDDIEL